jgi:16S rRNA (adenine1518-N6/adenine1519-N6)-dimethyltransferase
MPTKLPQHKARKRFGQNFLNNDFWIEKIADAIRPLPGQDLVEIGPGQAALTQKIIDRAGHLTCVEIDRDLARWLRTQFPESRMTLI